MVQGCGDRPGGGAKVPFKVFEKVNKWFEGVVGLGSGFRELPQEGFKCQEVGGVKEEVCPKGGDRVECSGGDGVHRKESSGEKKCEVAFPGRTC